MRPVDFSSDGIFLCGSAHSPKNIPESISQALAAAARASIPMRKGKVKTEAVTAWLDSDICVGCGACASVCPFDAITWSPTGLPVVNEAMCKGCGVCSVECPVGAMQLRYFKDDQLVPAIRGILADWTGAIRRDENEPNILCFACRWCSYAAADFAGVMRLKYPTNTRILLVPCSGRVDFRHILEAYEQGADGVVVTGCLKDQCHYVDGNILAEQRVNATKKALKVMGIEEERLEMFFCSAGMPREFAEYMNKFTERIKEIGRMDRKLFSYPIDSEGLEIKAG
jgi:heterodisulfide reductase subunit A